MLDSKGEHQHGCLKSVKLFRKKQFLRRKAQIRLTIYVNRVASDHDAGPVLRLAVVQAAVLLGNHGDFVILERLCRGGDAEGMFVPLTVPPEGDGRSAVHRADEVELVSL